ncbi:MAG TPA: hypothetical protein DCE41_28005 [Cytophagales bacterium]|nr:hypothetical protein [Cytophagales bacterium]HAA18293.1 hypothetical protein [Cytophagales bacterium]HAP63886.1 hypothetical protein [Cytophagales bacterium]
MLEYAKTILEKVSFDRSLFEKELRKAIKSLIPKEIHALRSWCYERFGDTHHSSLNKCFAMLPG